MPTATNDERTAPQQLNDFRQGSELFFNQILWAAAQIGGGRSAAVDAHVVVERREQFAERDGPRSGFTANAVRRSDHLAALHSTTGHQGKVYCRPVVAADLAANLRCSAEFTHDHHRAVLVQAALV